MPYLTIHGRRIYFEDSGFGKRVILFIHGTAGNCNYFANQVEFFRQQHRVVAVDLRGHGFSDPKSNSYSIHDFSEDILGVFEALKLKSCSIIGHSLGGLIALNLASIIPNLIDRLILLDTPIFIPQHIAQTIEDLAQGFRTDKYKETLYDFASQFFLNSASDPAIQDRILSDLLSFPQDRFLAIWDSMGAYDASAAIKACEVPLFYLQATAPSDLNYFRRLFPRLVTSQVVGSGHFLQLEKPEETNRIIFKFLTDEARSRIFHAAKDRFANCTAINATTVS